MADETQPTPLCSECGRIVWPSNSAELFIWYEGEDPGEEPLTEDLVRAAITHAECVDDFKARVNLDPA